VTLGRIFSCSHDQDHLHPHIQANFHTGSYTTHAIHPPKINTPKLLRYFSCILAKGEWGHQKKKSICSKSIEKIYKFAQIKEHRKNEALPPSKIKSRGESQPRVHRKTNKNIPHTCTSRSSCMTSFFLDLVFGSTTSCGTSEPHAYPTQRSTYKP
jgi:hypothetical protein